MIQKIILQSVKLRPGIKNNPDELLLDIINDTIGDVREIINYGENEELPSKCISIVKDLVIIKCNKLGSEGITSESYSGVSQSYIDDIPKDIKKKLYKLRKLW